MKDDLKDILLTEEEIQEICKDLGEQLTRDYKDKPLVCVGILKGSVMFMADLIKRIDTHLAIDFKVVPVSKISSIISTSLFSIEALKSFKICTSPVDSVPP